jgi:hypothetical protein
MTHLVKPPAGLSFARVVGEARKWLRKAVGLRDWVVLLVAAVAFISYERSGSTVVVTHDQARTFAGVLAQVIPVILLALYVESAAQWSRERRRREEEWERLTKLAAGVTSRAEKVVEVCKHTRRGEDGTPLDSEALSTLAQDRSNSLDELHTLHSQMSNEKRRTASQGTVTGFVTISLLIGIFGEGLALSCVLAPTDTLIELSTLALGLLLTLFGQRLIKSARSDDDNLDLQISHFIGGTIIWLAFAVAMAHVSKITVTG